MESTTDNRPLSAEDSELDVSSPLNHGDEQEESPLRESDLNKKIDNLAVAIRNLSEQLEKTHEKVEKIEDGQSQLESKIDQISHWIDDSLLTWTSSILKQVRDLGQDDDGFVYEGEEISPHVAEIISEIGERGEVSTHLVREILERSDETKCNVSPKTARRRMKTIASHRDEVAYRTGTGGDESKLMKKNALESTGGLYR